MVNNIAFIAIDHKKNINHHKLDECVCHHIHYQCIIIESNCFLAINGFSKTRNTIFKSNQNLCEEYKQSKTWKKNHTKMFWTHTQKKWNLINARMIQWCTMVMLSMFVQSNWISQCMNDCFVTLSHVVESALHCIELVTVAAKEKAVMPHRSIHIIVTRSEKRTNY